MTALYCLERFRRGRRHALQRFHPSHLYPDRVISHGQSLCAGLGSHRHDLLLLLAAIALADQTADGIIAVGTGASRELTDGLSLWADGKLSGCLVLRCGHFHGRGYPAARPLQVAGGAYHYRSDQVPLATLVQNTVGVSVVSALVGSAAALPLALLAVRAASRFDRWLVKLAYAGNVLPGIVIALALVFFASQHMLSLYQTLPLLILGYAIRFLPYSIGATESAFEQINPRFEESARSLGLTAREALLRITVPLARAGILAGLALVFLNVMKELPITLILRPIGFRTFATRIWSAYDEAFLSSIALPGLVLILVSATVLFVILRHEKAAP